MRKCRLNMQRNNRWGRTNVICVPTTKQNYRGTDIIRTSKSVNKLIIISAHNMWKWLKQITFISASQPLFVHTIIPKYSTELLQLWKYSILFKYHQDLCSSGKLRGWSWLLTVKDKISVTNSQPKPWNIPEEQTPQPHRTRSLKFCVTVKIQHSWHL